MYIIYIIIIIFILLLHYSTYYTHALGYYILLVLAYCFIIESFNI